MTAPPEHIDLTTDGRQPRTAPRPRQAEDAPQKAEDAAREPPDDTSGGRHEAEEGQVPSLDELVTAYREDGRPNYVDLRRRFECEHGDVVESYYARKIHAGALLVRPHGTIARLTQARRIKIRYDGGEAVAVQPEFEAALWRARSMERQFGLVLSGRSRRVLIEVVYSVVVYLLGVLDALAPAKGTDDGTRLTDEKRHERVSASLLSACEELDRLQSFSDDAARRAALRWYLFGLPLGIVVTGLCLFGVQALPFSGDTTAMVQVALASGASGALVSVMVRTNQGQRLVVDAHQGQAVTLLAGSFRPLIGGVFGVAIYVLVAGDLLPLALPEDVDQIELYFAGLAFLAGFSERWAQDTIVRSTSRLSAPGPEAVASMSLDAPPASHPAGGHRSPHGPARTGTPGGATKPSPTAPDEDAG